MKKYSALVPAVVIGLLLAVPLTYGKGSFPGTWSGIYSTSLSDNNAASAGSVCWLCHTPEGTSTWNAYGNAIKREMDAGASLAEALAAIENDNSDGDPPVLPMLPEGWTNIMEIENDGQPGWTTGSQTYYDADGNPLGTLDPPSGMATLDPDPTVDSAPATWGALKVRFRD